MAISSAGLGSGLDIEGIITKLMQVESQPLTKLATKEVSYQAKLSAYGSLSSAVSSLQSAATSLNSLSSSSTVSASSSDSSVLTASATSIASTGSYTVEVSQLAKSQQLVAVGQSSVTSSMGTGTLTFDFGTISGGAFNAGTGQYTGASFVSNGGGVKTVSITAANDSLTGIRDAVNAANIGVTATIINDGSGNPYRLAFSVNSTGASNSLKITVPDNPGGSLDNFLSNDPAGTQNLQQTVTAQDANFKINGLSITQSSNSVTSVISGVTMNLLKTNSGSPVTLSVGKDTSSLSKSVDGFVKTYNDLNTLIKALTKFDPKDSSNNGLLLGDTTVRSVQSQVRAILGTTVPGLSGSYTNLSQVGVTFNKDGSLSFDSSKLSTALNTNAKDTLALFSTLGRATDSLVSYVSSTSTTSVGSKSLDITQLASQGYTTAGLPADLTITAGVDDGLSLTVDGVAISVNIAAGVYASTATLASAIQSAINGHSSMTSAGSSVAVTEVGGVLTITSNRYGSTSSVVVGGGTAITDLHFDVPATTTAGVDLAGTFNGVAGSGSGQYLTSTDGLKIQVTGGVIGNRGTINFSRGYGYLVSNLATGLVGNSGSITAKTDGINDAIDRLNDQREVINRRLTAIEKRYRAQFAALDVAVANMNQTSTYLSQQLAALTGASSKK